MNEDYTFKELIERLREEHTIIEPQEPKSQAKKPSVAEVLQETNKALRGIELLLGKIASNA